MKFFLEVGDPAQFDLLYEGVNHPKLTHLFYDNNIQQPIAYAGAGCNGNLVAKLVAIGNADKECFFI